MKHFDADISDGDDNPMDDAPSADATAGEPTYAAHYMRRGKWTQCAHCKCIFAGEHYCGAPWQEDPGYGIDGISPEWRKASPASRRDAGEVARLRELIDNVLSVMREPLTLEDARGARHMLVLNHNAHKKNLAARSATHKPNEEK